VVHRAGYDEVSEPVRGAHPDLPVVRIPGSSGDRVEWETFMSGASSFRPGLVDENDPHMIMYTSGTTGRPKGAMFSHRRTVDDAFALGLILRAEERDVLLHFSPPFHVGNWDNMKQFLLMGATVILLREFNAEAALELVPRYRPTVMLGVPTMLHEIISNERFARTDMSSLRLIYYGAYDPSGILQRVADAFGAREGRVQLSHTYGLTEGGPFVAWCPPEEVFDHWGSIGRAAPGVEIVLMDDDGRPVPAGSAGEICFRGPRMSGYWRNEEATAIALADGWLHTGDVGVADTDGYLTIVDRKKDMIRTGGQNVWSKQVENHLLGHPAVADVAIIGLFDPVYEERVAAIVVPSQSPSDGLARELTAFVRDGMAGYNTPKVVHFVDELPRTTLGKVRKDVLRERFRIETD
jgi:fatty-acyl-CoA synthase